MRVGNSNSFPARASYEKVGFQDTKTKGKHEAKREKEENCGKGSESTVKHLGCVLIIPSQRGLGMRVSNSRT